MAARLPGANDCDRFWENLKGVVSSVREVPSDRWDADRYYSADPQAPNKSVSRWGGFIEGVDLFDPFFFGISPREAQVMDPQQRILLELAWACVEDAGHAPDELRGSRTGVFVGVMNFDYRERLTDAVGDIAGHMATGAYTALVANRISHHLDLRGPSVSIDTACSSSLVALHQAVQSLRQGECDQAFVGGVSVLCSPTHYVSFSKTGMLSPDGLCSTFDERANGYVRSEGAGLLLLKPLDQALHDGDRIQGVILGTAVNHGGKARTVTYPNPKAQADVIVQAHERAGVAPDSIGYIESHGTGTPKGDPMEISGLKAAFSQLAQGFGTPLEPGSCGLGSLKANVGHLEPVAGVAGVIKVLLAMKHRTLPGLAHFQQLNHRIDLSDSPFYIVEKTQDWPPRFDVAGQELLRRAGISSFGFGGVNAHAVLEEFIPPASSTPPVAGDTGLATLVVLSAQTQERLRASAQRLLDRLRHEHAEVPLADLAYTLQVGRNAMEHRLAMQVGSVEELQHSLSQFLEGQAKPGIHLGEAKVGNDVLASLTAGDSSHLVADWLAQGQPGKVLKLWVNGAVVAWERLYGAHKPRRIRLPSYPFARESHWVAAPHEMPHQVAIPAPASEPAHQPRGNTCTEIASRDLGDLLCFEERWVAQALPAGGGRLLRTLICFASHADTRQALAKGFDAMGVSVQLLFVADAACGAVASEALAVVDRNSALGYRQAFEQLQAHHGPADVVLYLWALEDERAIDDFGAIFLMLQAAAATCSGMGGILLAAQGEGGERRCHWEALIGFERSVGSALPNTPVAAIYEVARTALPGLDELSHWVRRLWAELQTPQVQSAVYEHGCRLVSQLQPLAAGIDGTVSSPLRPGGTYLITGGLGGLGRLFAEHLLRNWAANVVLIGRSAMNEPQRETLEALGRASGQVMYLQADVADPAQMSSCLLALKVRFGPLHGVLHAAGTENWQGLLACSQADFERVLRPKIQGTLVLDRLLYDEPIDFVCHFSSSSAVIGDFGAGGYSVGNRFQMAYARHRQESRPAVRTLAIAWPLWKDGGMRVGDEQGTAFYLASTGQRLLGAAQGLAAFDALLAGRSSHALVMVGEPQRIRRLLKLDTPPGTTPMQPVRAVTAAADAVGGMGERPLLQQVEQELLRLASDVLHVSSHRLALDGSLAGYGFDSINLTAFTSALARQWGVNVMPSVFFSYPTLEQLARYLVDKHSPALQCVLVGQPQGPSPASVERASSLRADARSSLAANVVSSGEAIAVIGMSGRFPGARDIEGLWRILAEGRSVVGPAPADREGGWPGMNYRGGFMPGVAEFDPLFFEISPREADNMDPRQRLLLEESWKALEDAGYGPTTLEGRSVGTFVGVEDGDYQRLTQRAADGEASITSTHNGILAGRLAYFLNLGGPTLAINTACSSGLVALHQACLSLRHGECDTAIVAAAHLMLTPHGCQEMDAAGMLSRDGVCYTFDERANGMVPAEAVVVLVLKRLAVAQADHDRIHALVAGSGINSDGRTHGITAPNGLSQARLIESVFRRHAINPERIDYLVAHGTGTKLGDPVEVNALTQAFRAFTSRSGHCALTSPKTNLGHALAASGLVSVVSLIEALRHDTIPASLNWARPNPFIDWQGGPFYVNSQARHWPRGERARMGAVSAFGMSGTNAHAVLQEYIELPHAGPSNAALPSCLFVVSAKTENALKRRVADLVAVFEAGRASLADISYTLLERRQHFNHRCAFVACSHEQAARLLRQAGSLPDVHWHQGEVPRDFRPPQHDAKQVDSVMRSRASANPGASNEELHALADLYCRGHGVAFGASLFGPGRPRLVSLPAYPFARVRHWVRPADRNDGEAPIRPVVASSASSVAKPASPAGRRSETEILMVVPVWEAVTPAYIGAGAVPRGRMLVAGATAETLQTLREFDADAIVLSAVDVGSAETLQRRLAGLDGIDHVVWLVQPRAVPSSSASLGDDAEIAAQADGVMAGFRLVQALLARGDGARPLHWTVVTVQAQSIGGGDPVDATHASVHGLVGALAKERTLWKIRLADLPADHAVPMPELMRQVMALPADRRGHAWVYRRGEWYRRQLVPVRPVGECRASYRQGGVYIVIGGAGDIGQSWSRHLISRHGARIVWVGRRERDADIEARLMDMARLGPVPHYIRADASRVEELQAVRCSVIAQFGAVHGVVHAAMVFSNCEIGGMTENQFTTALVSKVDVSVRIAQVFAKDALDFLLFFSSMVSLIKNARQSHYAAGCTFQDAWAQHLVRWASCPVKLVNWGYWSAQKNADAEEVQQLAALGMGLIEPAEGMQALEVLLGSSLNQLGVMNASRAFEVEGIDRESSIDVHALAPFHRAGGLPL